MKKAVIILAHQKPKQLNIFIDQLLSDMETYIFIHVNKACEDIIPSIKNDKRVFISNRNIIINWGGPEILQAELIMLEEALAHSIKFDYFIICTGQDLLVRRDLDCFLEKNKGKVFIERIDGNRPEWADNVARARLLYKWPKIYRKNYINRYNIFRILRKVHYSLAKKRFPLLPKKKIKYDVDSIKFYRDWFWCALPREIVEYVIEFSKKETEFMKIYQECFIPEECFMTTVIINSTFKESVSYNNGSTDTLTFLKQMENWHPPVLMMSDINEIENSGAFFARKFDDSIDAEVIEYFRDKIMNG